MHVYLSTSPTGNVFSRQWTKKWKDDDDESLPRFVWENITYGDWNDKRMIDLDVPLPTVSPYLLSAALLYEFMMFASLSKTTDLYGQTSSS